MEISLSPVTDTDFLSKQLKESSHKFHLINMIPIWIDKLEIN